jgi:hypothetical protein
MTTTVSAKLALPAPSDYRNAAGTLYDAHDAVESIEWRLQAIVNAYENDDLIEGRPAADDVVALYSFVDDVDRLVDQLTAKRDELRRELAAINLMRRDAEPAGFRT